MFKIRYGIIQHHESNVHHIRDDGSVGGRLAGHHLLAGYHWVRVDSLHIAIVAEIPTLTYDHACNHPHHGFFPHLSSRRPVVAHLQAQGKHPHVSCLTDCLGVCATHTAVDVVDMLGERYGSIFEPFR